jgi:hypothetical protein
VATAVGSVNRVYSCKSRDAADLPDVPSSQVCMLHPTAADMRNKSRDEPVLDEASRT